MKCSPHVLIWSVMLIVFSSGPYLTAQYSNEAFELKKAGDLYDERGFAHSSSITVDGSLVVSNSTGVVSYSYPISSHTVSGHPINVSLNYAGSVAFTTFNTYTVPAGSNGPYSGWSKFQQNKPAWILGVNGFAIQVLSQNLSFHCNTINDFDTDTEFADEDFVWLVDGYDFCNRMANLAQEGPNYVREEDAWIDVIRILRSDGSILELIKSTPTSIASSPNDSRIYEGYYAVNEPNAEGYAKVEYDDEYWPQYIQDAANASSTNYNLKPRKIHYYSGDGLEYVFREWLIPYGVYSYNGNESQQNHNYGQPAHAPSIFYLDEIVSASGRLTTFTRSRHYPPQLIGDILGDKYDNYEDKTRGRALITGFDGHSLTYYDNALEIDALGRTIKVEFHKVISQGKEDGFEHNGEMIGNTHLAEYGYLRPDTEELSKQWDDGLDKQDPKFQSSLGLVTRIIDPQGRVTEFDYEPLTREYKEYGFPKSGPDINVQLKNWRMTKVKEPASEYDICYRIEEVSFTTSCDIGAPSVVDMVYPSGGDYDPYFLNDVVSSVKKSWCGEELSTTEYGFIYTDVNSIPKTESCTVLSSTIVNPGGSPAVTQQTETIYEYRTSGEFEKRVPRYPAKRFTGVKRVTESIYIDNGVTIDRPLQQITETEYNIPILTNIPDDYLVLPVEKISTVVTDNGSYQKSKYIYNYQYETVRKFLDENGNTIQDETDLFGQGVKVKNEILQDQNGIDILRKEITYENLLLGTTPLTVSCDGYNKLESLKKYFLTYPNFEERWEDVMYDDPLVATYDPAQAFNYYAPPHLGLVKSEILYQVEPTPTPDTYLRGVERTYADPGYSADPTYIADERFRGRVFEEYMYGYQQAGPIMTAKYKYGWDNCSRVVPIEMRDANNAITKLGYSTNSFNTSVQFNDDQVQPFLFEAPTTFAKFFEVPIYEERLVRKYDPTPFALDNHSIAEYYQRTHYGQKSGVVDPNGWYSSFDYDYNGRLRRARLPFDFTNPTSYDALVGEEEIELYGFTEFFVTEEDWDCSSSGYSRTNIQTTGPELLWDTHFKAGWYHYNKPECECFTPPSTKKDGSVSTQAISCPQTKTFNSKEEYVGYITYIVSGDDPIDVATSLNDAYLELTVSSIEGECVLLHVSSPQLGGALQSFHLGSCSAGHLGDESGGSSGTGNGTVSSGGISYSVTGCSGSRTPVLDGANKQVIRVDLSDHLSYLVNTLDPNDPQNDRIVFKFVIGSPNTQVTFATEAQDSRPRLVLDGSFSKSQKNTDYTLMYEYDDEALTSTIRAKVDDYRHSFNTYSGTPGTFNNDPSYVFYYTGPIRRTETVHSFGPDYRLDQSETILKTWDNQINLSANGVVSFEYNGRGQVLKSIDQDLNESLTTYDELGRAVQVDHPLTDYYTDLNSDGIDDSSLPVPGEIVTAYFYGSVQDFQNGIFNSGSINIGMIDLSSQTFLNNYVEAVTTVNENGVHFVHYKDAYGRVRREAMAAEDQNLGSSAFDRHTKYEYDIQGRLISVTSPEGHVTSYEYDLYGRVACKTQPDMGTTSYAYDNVGNLRYSQTAQQYQDNKLTFYQYDDISRAYIVGEAIFPSGGPPEHGGGRNDSKGPSTLSGSGPRDLSIYQPTNLSHGGIDTLLTANPSLWMPFEGQALPPTAINIGSLKAQAPWSCSLPSGTMFADDPAALPAKPYISHLVSNYQPNQGAAASITDFEHLARYPHFVRTAVMYDELPEPTGEVWKHFPAHSQWNALAPTGVIRNMNGREVAVAYREYSNQPYHFTVMSYDPRGRVEAVIHYTENLGFDVVYYTYNSMNRITSIRSVDPLRQHTTWYAYDNNGRMDSVWTKTGNHWSGLYGNAAGQALANPQYITPQARPSRENVDIVYEYDDRGLVENMQYDPIIAPATTGLDVTVGYEYNQRGWVKRIDAVKADPGGPITLFEILNLEYDPAGQLLKQSSQHQGQPLLVQYYEYDKINELTKWDGNLNGTPTYHEQYDYDRVGNRNFSGYMTGGPATVYTHGAPAIGPNQLSVTDHYDGFGTLLERQNFTYDLDGAIKTRKRTSDPNGTPVLYSDEAFEYSYRDLLWHYTHSDPSAPPGPMTQSDWQYRYNAGGEREQKRLYSQSMPDETIADAYPWVYYLLDGAKRQLSVWHGQQTTDPNFCEGLTSPPGTRYVYLYPTEYLTYGYGASPSIVTHLDQANMNGKKEYRVVDHLGSTRLAITNSGVENYDYAAYGGYLAVGVETRRSFIGKEKDAENGLGDFGVRKYDENIGRFLTTDPLWETYRGWSPYQYGLNNPSNLTDASGMIVDVSKLNSNQIASLIEDLKLITGLNIGVNYEVGKNGGVTATLFVKDRAEDPGYGSATAKRLVEDIIKDQHNVLFVSQSGSRSIAAGNRVALSQSNIEANIAGARHINPRTMGWGMTFIHEFLHSDFSPLEAGTRQHPGNGLGNIASDRVIQKVNVIRAELGEDWGQRLSHGGFERTEADPNASVDNPDATTKFLYLPFNNAALQDLKNGAYVSGRDKAYIRKEEKYRHHE